MLLLLASKLETGNCQINELYVSVVVLKLPLDYSIVLHDAMTVLKRSNAIKIPRRICGLA